MLAPSMECLRIWEFRNDTVFMSRFNQNDTVCGGSEGRRSQDSQSQLMGGCLPSQVTLTRQHCRRSTSACLALFSRHLVAAIA